MKTIRIKYIRDIEPIKKISQGDWIDLRCAENQYLHAGQFVMIPLGIAMELPEGYEAIVLPRSSTFKRYGILMGNSAGVIDNSYSGDSDEWMVPAYVTRDTVIGKNDRICQFRIQKVQPDIEFEVVQSLGNEDRGGFGSTGRK